MFVKKRKVNFQTKCKYIVAFTLRNEKFALSLRNTSKIKSQVKLRMIRAYEQGYRDITKASYENLSKLAVALECDIEKFLEK